MKSFTVRVELQSAVLADYTNALHPAMEAANFRKSIISDKGIKYKLPNGEYNISGNFSRAEVLELAKKALASTSKSGEILVTESSGRNWFGLSVIS